MVACTMTRLLVTMSERDTAKPMRICPVCLVVTEGQDQTFSIPT